MTETEMMAQLQATMAAQAMDASLAQMSRLHSMAQRNPLTSHAAPSPVALEAHAGLVIEGTARRIGVPAAPVR